MLTTLDWIFYAVGVFAAVLGATYQLANQEEQKPNHSVFKLVVGLIAAVFLTALLEALLEFYAGWNWIVVTILGMFFSLAAEHVIRLIMNYQKGAKSFWQYVVRMKKVNDLISSGKIDLDANSTNEEPTKPESP